MVAILEEQGPVRLIGCAPLYKVAQTTWTARLTIQMTMYVLFIGASMAAGGLMPWLLEMFYGWKMDGSTTLSKLFSQGQGYTYDTNNTYAFCPKKTRLVSYEPLQRGYPAPPLAPQNGQLYDAWYHKKVMLKGVSWFGFNTGNGGVHGVWAGGSSAATDFEAITYELKLLGFNTIRLPFTFDMLKRYGADQVQKCTPGTKSSWAQRATDPALEPQPEYASVPDPPVYLHVDAGLKHMCNTYLPTNSTPAIERMLWTIQYLVANGFYVVLDYHPDVDDTTALDAEDFARAWMYLWATVTCLPNFTSDIRGRLLLDLLNEPDKVAGSGLAWNRVDDTPGLDEIYLTVMDSIEHITPDDALYMLQGSALSKPVKVPAGGYVRHNTFGLSPGDGFVTDTSIIMQYELSNPNTFFSELLHRPYRNRVLLAPHLYGPANSGVQHAAPDEVASRVDSSWGALATEGYCAGNECMKFPVVAGEMGSQLDTKDELSYYYTIAQYTQLGIMANGSESPLSGWIWWAYNANSNGIGGLVTDDWQEMMWPKLRYLTDYFGMKPWYQDPSAFIKNIAAEQADALEAREAADAAAAAEAAALVAASDPLLNLTSLSRNVQLFDGSSSNSKAASASGGSSSSVKDGTADLAAPAPVLSEAYGIKAPQAESATSFAAGTVAKAPAATPATISAPAGAAKPATPPAAATGGAVPTAISAAAMLQQSAAAAFSSAAQAADGSSQQAAGQQSSQAASKASTPRGAGVSDLLLEKEQVAAPTAPAAAPVPAAALVAQPAAAPVPFERGRVPTPVAQALQENALPESTTAAGASVVDTHANLPMPAAIDALLALLAPSDEPAAAAPQAATAAGGGDSEAEGMQEEGEDVGDEDEFLQFVNDPDRIRRRMRYQ